MMEHIVKHENYSSFFNKIQDIQNGHLIKLYSFELGHKIKDDMIYYRQFIILYTLINSSVYFELTRTKKVIDLFKDYTHGKHPSVYFKLFNLNGFIEDLLDIQDKIWCDEFKEKNKMRVPSLLELSRLTIRKIVLKRKTIQLLEVPNELKIYLKFWYK